MQVEIEQLSETLETLKPATVEFSGVVPANAWDGSGLCWQWRGKCSGKLTDMQFRPLPDSDRMLARVGQQDGPEGWYLLSGEG
jgi:hypothetical protein